MRSDNLCLVASLRIHKRRRFRQIFRRGILFSDGLFELPRILRLDALPSFLNLRILDTALNRRCVRCLRLEGSRWCHHIELVALKSLTVFRVRVGRRTKRKFNLLDILIGLCRYGLNPRPEVIDHVVVGDNVRDVLSLIDDLNVSLGWLEVLRVVPFVPMRIADKSVGSRPNAIIRVGPRRYRWIRGEVCFGRKRSPANVFVTFPPRDPSRSPLISRDPAPSGPTNIGPSAVVVGCPGKTFV